MTLDNKTLIEAYKLVLGRLIPSLIESVTEGDAQRALHKSLMLETLALAASLHHDAGGRAESFMVMAEQSIILTESDGATKQ